MINEIFSCPVRKYHLNDDLIKRWAFEQYESEKFNITAPFRLQITDLPANLVQGYTDVLENLLSDLGISDTHVGIITGVMLSGLEKGDTIEKTNTLPSHYTATHYISGSEPDVYYHPARSFLNLFNPSLDEWRSAAQLYVNEGDVIIHPSYLEYSTPIIDKHRLSMTLLIQLQEQE